MTGIPALYPMAAPQGNRRSGSPGDGAGGRGVDTCGGVGERFHLAIGLSWVRRFALSAAVLLPRIEAAMLSEPADGRCRTVVGSNEIIARCPESAARRGP
jgi:hypothetical protein